MLRKLAERSIGILRPVAPPPGEQSAPRYDLPRRARRRDSRLAQPPRTGRAPAKDRGRAGGARGAAARGNGAETRSRAPGSPDRRARLSRQHRLRARVRTAEEERGDRADAARAVDPDRQPGRRRVEPGGRRAHGGRGVPARGTLEARSAALSYLQTNAGLPKLLDGHPRSVNDIAFSADSKILASGGSDGVVRLWDVAEGDTIGAPLRPGLSIVNNVAIEGELLAVAGQIVGATGGPVAVWDIGNPESPRRMSTVRGRLGLIALGGGNAPVLAGTAPLQDSIALWDLRDPRRRRRLPSIEDINGDLIDPNALAFSPNGRTLAAGGTSGSIVLWRVGPDGGARHLATILSLEFDHGHSRVESLAFSADGKFLVSAGEGVLGETANTVLVWDVSTPARPRFVANPTGHVGNVYGVDFDREGSPRVRRDRRSGSRLGHRVLAPLWSDKGARRGRRHQRVGGGAPTERRSHRRTTAARSSCGRWRSRTPWRGWSARQAASSGIWRSRRTTWWRRPPGDAASSSGRRAPATRRSRSGGSTPDRRHLVRGRGAGLPPVGATGTRSGSGTSPEASRVLSGAPTGRSTPSSGLRLWPCRATETPLPRATHRHIVLSDVSDRENVTFLAAVDHGARSVDALAFDPDSGLLASETGAALSVSGTSAIRRTRSQRARASWLTRAIRCGHSPSSRTECSRAGAATGGSSSGTSGSDGREAVRPPAGALELGPRVRSRHRDASWPSPTATPPSSSTTSSAGIRSASGRLV